MATPVNNRRAREPRTFWKKIKDGSSWFWEKIKKVPRGLWGGTVGALSGACGGIVAPITGVYKYFAPTQEHPSTGKKILGGLAAGLTAIIFIPSAIYGTVGLFGGAILGGYSSQKTTNPIYIAKTTFLIIEHPLKSAAKSLHPGNLFTKIRDLQMYAIDHQLNGNRESSNSTSGIGDTRPSISRSSSATPPELHFMERPRAKSESDAPKPTKKPDPNDLKRGRSKSSP